MTVDRNTDSRSSHLDELELDALRQGEGSVSARRHLEACRRCREELAGMEKIAADLRSAHLQPAPPDPEAEQRLLEDLGRGVSSSRGTRRTVLIPVLALTAAAAALVTVFFLPGKDAPPDAPTPVATETIRGDLNNDQVVDGRDLEKLKDLIAQGADAPDSWDLSGDGRIDNDDLRILDGLIAAADDSFEDKVGC